MPESELTTWGSNSLKIIVASRGLLVVLISNGRIAFINFSLSTFTVGIRSVLEVRSENKLIGLNERSGAFSRVASKSKEIPALLGEIEMLAVFAVKLILPLTFLLICNFKSLIATTFVFPPISIPKTLTPLGIPEPTASHAASQIRDSEPTEMIAI